MDCHCSQPLARASIEVERGNPRSNAVGCGQIVSSPERGSSCHEAGTLLSLIVQVGGRSATTRRSHDGPQLHLEGAGT